ncbi:ABC transporter substrate-binding protein [Alkaliphilus peptidifermentans]|uniref:Oligopeptide transport system substrate-binding protein n=1 Tax=Alkaliphilus peptidifermentans DSM 18978 TaxID=1120976 RepID=A0A1G5BMN7_9FIRM|nr:ABC transporter substrate-binding protein [Alkaliphilus peptidifermentans]SCX91387.1 oligopeptide transport system substrate-binding protein [Alkaliphilus peptidifermentans DSM 18978]
MYKRKKMSLILALLMIFSIFITACSSEEAVTTPPDETVGNAEASKYGGIYESYIEADFNTLDPAFATAALDGFMVSLIYDALIGFDAEGKVMPALAKSWETPDEVTYIFDLVDNAKFHNGNSFTANDVKYTFERVLDPEVASPRTWVFDKLKGAEAFMEGNAAEVEGIEILSDYKIKLTLEDPFAPFLSMLGMPAAHIVDKNEVEKYADQTQFALHPVGTGPYIFDVYNQGERLTLNVFEDYFAGRAFLDGINYRVIPDPSTQVAEFEAGNLDELLIPAADLERFRNNPTYRPYLRDMNTFWNFFIGLMADKPPFDDVRVRQAFNYGVDREAIVRAVRGDTAIVSHGPIPPGLDGFRPEFKSYPYDPEKSKALLAELGYSPENPLPIEFLHIESTANVALLEPVQAMLNQVGFDVNLISMESQAARVQFREGGSHNVYYLSWGADYPDAENYLFPLFHSSNWGGGGNGTRYSNPEVDALLEKAHKTANYNERIKLYQDIEDIVVEEAARMWFFLSRNWRVYKPEVKDVVLYRIFNANKMLDVWLDR